VKTLGSSLVATWITVAAALLAAGLFLGRLDQRVTTLEQQQQYLHGRFTVPKE